MDPRIDGLSSSATENEVNSESHLTSPSTELLVQEKEITTGSCEASNTHDVKITRSSDPTNDEVNSQPSQTNISMNLFMEQKNIISNGDGAGAEVSSTDSVKTKRSSSDMAANEADSRPYLMNLSTDSLVKQEKIVISTDEFSVGRSLDAALKIADPFISRKHCVLRKQVTESPEGKSWFLHQLGSSLSWINAKRITVNEKIKLNNGDLIEFGDERNYIFKFYAFDLEAASKRLKLKEEEEKSENLSMKLMERELEQEKMKQEKAELELKMQERIQMLEAQYQKQKEELEKKIQNENLEKQKLAEERVLIEEKLAQERVLIEEKLAQEKLLAEKKFNDEKLCLEQKLKGMEEMVKQIEEEKLRKEEERKLLEEEAERIKASLAEKEAALKETVEQLKKDEEYEKNIKKMTEELERVKQDLVQNMSKQSVLEKQLEDTAGSSYLAAKTELLESFGDVIETELQCSICNELFVEAMTLNCMHTFCSYCLNKWKKRKKECPVCRCKIKTENRMFIWDSFIEKMVEKLSDDLRERRRTLIAERKGKHPSTSNQAHVPSVNSSAGPYQYVNGAPFLANAQPIRIAVPVTNVRPVNVANITNMHPNVRLANIPQIRLLGSIDLTQRRTTINGTNASSSTSRSTPSRSTPNILNVNRHVSSSTSSSSRSPGSRRSARLNARAEVLSAKRRRLRMSEPGTSDEISLDDHAAGSSSDPPVVIEDAVIEIADEPSVPTLANNSDSDSDDNVIVVPVRRRSNNPSGSNATVNHFSQPSTSGSTSTEPSTSRGSPGSRTSISKRKRLVRDDPIVLSSSSSDVSSNPDRDSDDSDDSDSSVEGYYDYAYSGGRCWECGRRGHWARACPNR